MSTSSQRTRLSDADRARLARARELLAEPHGHDLYDLAKRGGALEWRLGDILDLVARLTSEDGAR
ncbi:MAG TPA: hypothetical protein VIY52_01495 [Streptosporangiaceae bacterium]